MGFMSILFPRRGRTVVRHYSSSQAKERREFNQNLCFWICIVVSIILTGVTYHTHTVYKDIQHSLGDIIINEPGLIRNPSHAGTVVHIAAPPTSIHPKKAVSDIDFNVGIYGPFSMRREVEYCQWTEHQSTKTHKHSDGSETTETTYYYTKGWRSSPISSIFFNQPGNHHNPQRDPYPSGTVDSTDVSINNNEFTVDSNLARYVSVNSEPVVNWDINNYNTFMKSQAHNRDNFYYTNKDGWFYSPYTPSVAERLAKTAVQYMEGSLFDFQVADLFSECTAGDIRVRYRTKTPMGGVSLIGRQVDSTGRIDTFKSIDDREVDAIYEGMHSADEVKRLRIADAFSNFMWAGIGMVISWVVSGVVLMYKNKAREDDEHEKDY